MRKTLLTAIFLLGFTSCAFAQWRPWLNERPQPPRRSTVMPTDIYPQLITVLPADVQTFTVRSTPPPVVWRTLTNVTLNTDDQSLTRVTTGLFGAAVEPRVHAGIAGVQWTISPAMIPSSGATIQFYLFGVGTRLPTHGIFVHAGPTSTVVKDEGGSTIDTVSHTIASGDTYYLEVSGNIFRLAINGVTETTYEVTTATEYPIRASVFGDGTFAVTPAVINPPTFTGTWDILPSDSSDTNWTATGGTLNDSTDTWQVRYTAGNQPGIFTLTAVIGDEALQSYTATVIIPPLSVLGLTSVTLQPGEKYRFKTNYDDAQSKIVSWSVASGGGSFANGEYTAATAPGTSVLVAAYGDQEVSVTVTVPAVMTITTSTSVATTAAKLGEVLTLTTNMSGTINWTRDLGTLSATAGSTVTWTAPNQSQLTALITATNGTYTVTAEILVLKHFPYDPQRDVNWERRKTVLVSRAEDRSRTARVKDYNDEAFEPFELNFRDRSLTEYNTAQAFWDEHYPGLRLIYEDKIRQIRKVVYMDSDVRVVGYGSNAISYSFRVIEG